MVNTFDSMYKHRIHAISLSSNVPVHSKNFDQETKCKQPMKYDSKRWLSLVEYFRNHCDKPQPLNEKLKLKAH